MYRYLKMLCLYFILFHSVLSHASDFIINGESGNRIRLTHQISNRLAKSTASSTFMSWRIAEFISKNGKTTTLMPFAKINDKEGIIWYSPSNINESISPNKKYIVFDINYFGILPQLKVGKDTYKFDTEDSCPIVDFRNGCIVYIGHHAECGGGWTKDSEYKTYSQGNMNFSNKEILPSTIKAIWIDFISLLDGENGEFSRTLDMFSAEGISNHLNCSPINSNNLAYYKLIKQQLKNEKNKDYKLIQKAIKEAAVTSDKVSKQIVSKKAALYNTPRNKDKSSAYLVAGDSVVIVDESKIKRGWCEISYITKTGKILNKWIHAADIAGNSNIKTLADEPEVKKQEEDFGGEKTLFRRRYSMIDSVDHKPITFTKYKIKRADGRIEKGVTDKHGYTRPIKMGKEGKKEYIYLKLDI